MFRWVFALALMAQPVFAAEFVTVEAEGSVAEVADRFTSAVEGAGATVFVRVDHGAGAATVEMPIPDAVLVVFGNPRLGTPAIAADPRAGLALPLRVLIHDVEGQTTLTYQDVDALFDGLDIAADAPFRDAMRGALERLTTAAAAP